MKSLLLNLPYNSWSISCLNIHLPVVLLTRPRFKCILCQSHTFGLKTGPQLLIGLRNNILQELVGSVKQDFGSIDILVHSLANGPEVYCCRCFLFLCCSV